MRSPAASFDLRAVLSDEITNAIAELSTTPVRPKPVHRCRLHIKRARALARVGRACAPGLSDVFNETARGVMRALAQTRDLAALGDYARALSKRSGKKQAAALLIVSEKFDAMRAATPPLNLESVRAGLRDLLALAQVWPEASARQIEKGADRIAWRARVACKRGRGADAPARRHDWRKREKDRLYAAMLLGKAWPDDRQRRIGRGTRLGEVLGRERDALLLIERLEREPGLAGTLKNTERALAALRERCAKLAPRADRLGAKLHRGGA
jgi:hypothetical protein